MRYAEWKKEYQKYLIQREYLWAVKERGMKKQKMKAQEIAEHKLCFMADTFHYGWTQCVENGWEYLFGEEFEGF